MKSSAVFVGTARNCAEYLPRALACWTRLGTLFDEASFIVAENDSVDQTKTILADWALGAENRRFLSLDGLGDSSSHRSVLIAAARNRLLDTIRQEPQLSGADWLIVMDMDDVSLALTPERLSRCMRFTGWDALFANQIFFYYDVWALRSERSPNDFARVLEAVPRGWRYRLSRFVNLTWRSRPIPLWRKPIPVASAFGGFGIYRMEVALNGRYCGWRDGRPICEHVPFHEQLCKNGARLYVHPGLVNAVPTFVDRIRERVTPTL